MNIYPPSHGLVWLPELQLAHQDSTHWNRDSIGQNLYSQGESWIKDVILFSRGPYAQPKIKDSIIKENIWDRHI